MSLGNRLKEERLRLGLTQLDMTLLASVTPDMWGRYERGVSSPNAEVLVRVCAHGFDINYLIGGSRTISENTLDDGETGVIDDYRSTDDEGRAQIKRTARIEAQRVVANRKA